MVQLKFSRYLAYAIITSVSVLGCGRSTDVKQVATEDNGWSNTVVKSENGIEIERSKMTDAQIRASRNEYRRVNLIQIPVDNKFNTNVFQMTDQTISAYKNTAFIAPKLYSYGSLDGGTLTSYQRNDGKVALSFNVIFSDGMTNIIINPKSEMLGTYLPDSFTVKYLEELKQLLKNQFNLLNLAPLMGCPKNLSLVVAGKSYDVTPQAFLKGDFCQLNVPVSLTIVVPNDDAKMIMNVALPARTVDLIGTYETKTSYPTSKIVVNFDRQKIFSELKAELGLKIYFIESDVKLAITKVVQKQMMNITIQGTPSDLGMQIAQKINADFFEPFTANPNTPEADACAGTSKACVRFSSVKMNQNDSMSLEWTEESNVMSGQNYITMTKLKSTPTEVRIGDENCASTEFAACNRLSNNGFPRDTGLTVGDGTIINLRPTTIFRERRDSENPVPVRTNNEICVRVSPACSTFAVVGITCNLCEKENHWSEATDFSSGTHVPETITDPAGKIDGLYDGIDFGFSSVDPKTRKKKTLVCPSSIFERKSESGAASFKLSNVDGCSPFSAGTKLLSLSLINRIHVTQAYQFGRRVVLWNGQVTEEPHTGYFNPRLDFSGIITVNNNSFSSEAGYGKLLLY